MSGDDTGRAPFQELRVVELAGSVAGGWAARLFAGLGAQVTKLVPPEGDALAAMGAPRGGGSTVTAYLDTDKAVVPEREIDVAAAMASADVVIESSAPDPLVPRSGAGAGPGTVSVLLSPFGVGGPYAGYRSTSLTDEALSGHAFLSGDPAREPLGGPGLQSSYAAGALGFVGAMAALLARRRTGRGQVVEVTHLEAMVALHQFTFVKYTHGGQVLRRQGNRYAGPGHPIGSYECADGWVSISAPNGPMARAALHATGNGDLLDEHRIAELMVDGVLIDERLRPWIRDRTVDEVIRVLQEARVPVAPTRTMLELLGDEHFAARELWRGVDELFHPGPPFRLSHHPWSAGGSRGPGRHDPPAPAATPVSVPLRDVDAAPPLAGVRVLDLTRVWAGPLAARILAELGADVVMIEAPMARGGRSMPRPLARSMALFPNNDPGDEPWNRNGFQNDYARNKRSVALDITDDAGRAALVRLIERADVLVENYSARVMPGLGLDEDQLHATNPSLVYVTMPGYGRSGPCRDWLAFGNVIDAHAGMTSITGYHDGPPWKPGIAWPDAIAGVHAAGATLVALWDREDAAVPGRGGVGGGAGGSTVEVAQIETVIATLGHELLEAQVLGHDRRPRGNRDAVMAPQGVYPCRGDDRWIAISVTDDGAWAALCRLAGLPQPVVALSTAERHLAHDELDDLLAELTRDRDAIELFHQLQAAGVASAPVLDAPGVLADDHLAARSFFVDVTSPATGTHPANRLPIRLSETPAVDPRPGPRLGEHAEEVLVTEAGLTRADYDDLVARGVVSDRPPR